MRSRRWCAALVAAAVVLTVAPSARADDGPVDDGPVLDAVTQTVPDGGGTVSTNAASTPADPVGTTVTSPRGGTVSIQESALPADHRGLALVPRQVVVRAPEAAADAPMLLEFRLDRSLLTRPGRTVTAFRNGREVADCTDAGTAAVPAPCLERAAAAGSEDLAVRVRTRHGGAWTFGAPKRVDSGPIVTCARPDGEWHGENVTLSCTATDPGGLADPSDAAFELTTSVADGTETAAAATGSRQVCNAAGECVAAGPLGGNKVDRKAPAVDLLVPAEGATYAMFAKHTVNYACLDAGSGPASCRGTVADGAPLPTGMSAYGDRSFTVAAVDGVGNRREVVRRYKVAPVAGGG